MRGLLSGVVGHQYPTRVSRHAMGVQLHFAVASGFHVLNFVDAVSSK